MASFRGRLWFCSNFCPVQVHYQCHDFPTSEHAYAWAKCAEPADKALVLMARIPGEAKRIARKAKLVDNWNQIKIGIMREILWAKFSNPECRSLLEATGDEPLVEHNEWGDSFWGVCNGVGQNWLGKLLMEIRDDLKKRKAMLDEIVKLSQELGLYD